jgi:hypothetical protein
MNRDHLEALTRIRPLATGPTIKATHAQRCGWCLEDVVVEEPVTYTRESGWCHAACTTDDPALVDR